jgi:hypothetical protein
VPVKGSLRPANFTGLGLLLWKLVDRHAAGRHAVPGPVSLHGWRARPRRLEHAARRGSCVTSSTCSTRSSSRALVAGPAAGALRRRTGPAGGGAQRRRP